MTSRLEFALRNATAAHWEPFERFTSQFLADEYPDLRTLASPSGDKGRDGALCQPVDQETVAIQYSVASDWDDKIRRTVKRLSESHPQVRVLIYMTNQRIGAAGDSRRQVALSDYGIHVDVRDRSWFIEREPLSPNRQKTGAWFSEYVLGDVLGHTALIDKTGAVLSSEESRSVLLYLVLQRKDDDLDRHLTKLCYDAIVRMVLRDTDNDRRKARSAIYEAVTSVLPTHDRHTVTEYVDRALERMNKRYVRHWVKQDEFCLTFEERTRIGESIATLRVADEDFEQEILRHGRFVAEGLDVDLSTVTTSAIAERIRRVMETFLFERGETFVKSLASGQAMMFVLEELEELTIKDLARFPDASSIRGALVPLVSKTLERALLRPSDLVQTYLRAVGDGYTLMAFLRETPNVQSAVSKLFSHAEVWLDTTALLPVFAEDLLEPHERSYTNLLSAVRDAGVQLRVTTGVLEEIDSHIDNALLAHRLSASWKSRTPFLFASYLWAGYSADGFPAWTEVFKGQVRPIEDLREYLAEIHGITMADLADEYENAPEALRWHSDAYWQEVHERRRTGRSDAVMDPGVIKQLAMHDSENFVGVLQRRAGEEVGNPFGYSTWWLTMDRSAFEAAHKIADRCGYQRLDSPVLAFDFLSYYLAVGPVRRRLDKERESQLPLIMDTGLTDSLPQDLLDAAKDIRTSMEQQEDRVIRRRIRDHLDQEKLKGDKVGRTTMDALQDDIRQALISSAATRQ